MRISNFFTLFWIIYFPTCLAFYTYDYADELLCVLLVGYAFLKSREVRRTNAEWTEMLQCAGIITFYLLYSLVMHVTTTKGILLDFLQQIRPYAVFYLTLTLAPKFSAKQKKLIVYSMLLTMVGYFIKGRHVGINAGLIEDNDLPMVALTTGMTYYLFTKPNNRNKYIAIGIMLVGLLSGKSKYIGQCITFIAIVMYVKGRVNFKSPKAYLSVAALVVIVMFFTWTKFSQYYIEGFDKDDVEDMAARPATYKTGVRILIDYFPLGSGMGSFGTAAAAKEYSPLYYKYHLDGIWGLSPDNPMFLADSFYPTLAEYGIVGIFLFGVFWKRRIKEINKIRSKQHYQMALVAVLALAIDSTANTAYLSGGGMGLFMTLAICLRSNLYLKPNKKLNLYGNPNGNLNLNANEDETLALRKRENYVTSNHNENETLALRKR